MHADRMSKPPVELIGGSERRAIVVVPFDPKWAATFVEHHTRIRGALRQRAQRVEHIGSTSVPGLVAKPIVDIQVSVADVDDDREYVPELEAAGYRLRVREAGHRMLRTPDLGVHVHVCTKGSDWERRHLLFRDWLRHSDSDRAAYAEVKTDLATRSWPTMDHYADAKTPVIAAITTRAEAWAATGAWNIDPASR